MRQVNGVRGDFDESLMFSGIMPNQPVRLVYLYESSIQGYGITVKYEDNGTADSRLKDIIPPENSGPYAADSDVQGVYREQYGYSLESHTVRPADSQIQFGGNDWSGIMPNDEVTITYKHDRIPAQTEPCREEAAYPRMCRHCQAEDLRPAYCWTTVRLRGRSSPIPWLP